jgi:indolepyruvate ferredoxin oxidoreductase
MMKVFGVLAKMKSLRGSMFDVFGYTAERRTERALVIEYKQTILQLLPLLNTGNLASAVAVASVPEDIRGYGHVKERHLLAAKNKQATLLAEFNTVAVPQKAA